MSNLSKIEKDLAKLVPEDRALLADYLLLSLEQRDLDVEKAWVEVANRRLAEMRSGAVKPVPGKDVFEKVRLKLGK